MADSIDVLATLKLVYGIYAFIAISLIGWFGYRITKPKDDNAGAKPALFYTYIVVLAVVGTGLHFLTYNAVPWVYARPQFSARMRGTRSSKIHSQSVAGSHSRRGSTNRR